MTVEIKYINSRNWLRYQKDLQALCESSEQDPSPAAANYHWESWQDNPSSLMYALTIEKRYDSGFFNLLYENNKLVAVSGCYAADWHPQVLIIGSRTYTHHQHRDRKWYQSNYLFPRQCQHAQDSLYHAAILSVNGYNLRLTDFFQSISQRQHVKKKMVNFYQTFTLLPDWYMIKSTAQKIAVRLFNGTTWQEFHDYFSPPVTDLPTAVVEPYTQSQEQPTR